MRSSWRLRSITTRDTLPDGLAYLPGSARLARVFDTGLNASDNPGNVNAAGSGTFVPLADGGTHEPANVQCAHYLCNSVKSDGAANDQLRLVG